MNHFRSTGYEKEFSLFLEGLSPTTHHGKTTNARALKEGKCKMSKETTRRELLRCMGLLASGCVFAEGAFVFSHWEDRMRLLFEKESSGSYICVDNTQSVRKEPDETDVVRCGGRAKITVLGIGGCGSNAINNMIEAGLDEVHFIASNTDWQAIERNLAPKKIQLGTNSTKGLGTFGQPEMGSKATRENIDMIREAVSGSDMVFITAGLGGGTGTGGAPIVAQICKEMGALTVAVVTKPFMVEGDIRTRHAEDGLKALQDTVDTLITVSNNHLFCLADKHSTFLEIMKRADNGLIYAVKSISDLIVKQTYIGVDFTDVKTVMGKMGLALMGTGVGRGENRATQAVKKAISSQLLENISIHDARAAVINISGGPDIGMDEFEEALSIIHKEVDDEADIILSMIMDEKMEGEVRVTAIISCSP